MAVASLIGTGQTYGDQGKAVSQLIGPDQLERPSHRAKLLNDGPGISA
ncbi:MAG: hypothetical protein ABJ263_17940 [Tateyamaria sp.]